MNLRSLLLVSAIAVAGAAHANIVFSKVYGGGGNAGAYYANDFVELLNSGTTATSLSGLSLYYASATGAYNSFTDLGSTVLAPGQYFLVSLAPGTNTAAAALPTPDFSFPSITASATAGKFLLYRGTGALALTDVTANPGNVQDLVGFGTTANQFEGTGPAPAPSNTTADVRGKSGLMDTNNNSVDFTAVAADQTLTINNTKSPFAPVQTTPEPASLAALGVGALALLRRRRAAK